MIRVVCLGGSSTFGVFARDDSTYPAVLERLFSADQGAEDGRVEVINAGIPHAETGNLVAMTRAELMDYAPDVITIYTGFNDAAFVLDANLLQRAFRWAACLEPSYCTFDEGVHYNSGRWITEEVHNTSNHQVANVRDA